MFNTNDINDRLAKNSNNRDLNIAAINESRVKCYFQLSEINKGDQLKIPLSSKILKNPPAV